LISRFRLIRNIEAGRTVIIISYDNGSALNTGKAKNAAAGFTACRRLLVHSINDLNRLRYTVENVTLFPHGVIDYIPTTEVKINNKPIASKLFLTSGTLELIDAFALMPNWKSVMIAMRSIPFRCQLPYRPGSCKIQQLNIARYVELITDYSRRKSLDFISKADLIVFPYQETGESSSAAVRYGLATGRPVAVTPLAIFDDVGSAVLKLPGFSPALVAQGITSMLSELEKQTPNVQEGFECNRGAGSPCSQLSDRLYGLIKLCIEQARCKVD
jgi:hypothetical protein